MARSTPKLIEGLTPSEYRLREATAKLQLALVKTQTAQLATYQAAQRGRATKDWKANNVSADMAIIPDAAMLNSRSRQLVRDTWIGSSMILSARRNVVGTGIDPMPTAKDQNGKALDAFNQRARTLFWKWASNKSLCDMERRQNFYQKQRLLVSELFAVGQAFLFWSYERVKHGAPVGLKFSTAEAEQLDTSITSYDGREVRGGVEVDPDTGAAIAFHFYCRHPNDLRPTARHSKRIDARRVFHFFDQSRVLQTQGVARTAPVMAGIRDFDSYTQSNLYRARMESCIGMIVKQASGAAPGQGPLSVAAASGDDRTTSSGMREIDFVPGMTPHLAPGEEIEPFIPTSPGNQFEGFTAVTLRGIAAGVGMSYDTLARRSDSNYSAARQTMLEDHAEFAILQDDLISDVVMPIYELFLQFAILEGRFDGVDGYSLEEFADDPARFTDAAYITPAKPWIDPEKEANAAAKMIDYRLSTRDEILSSRQRRFGEQISLLSAERETADEAGVHFPEDVDARVKLADAAQKEAEAAVSSRQAVLERIKGEAEAYGVAVRAGLITPQVGDEEAFRKKLGLPPVSDAARAAWQKTDGTRTPITLAPPDPNKPAVPVDPNAKDVGGEDVGGGDVDDDGADAELEDTDDQDDTDFDDEEDEDDEDEEVDGDLEDDVGEDEEDTDDTELFDLLDGDEDDDLVSAVRRTQAPGVQEGDPPMDDPRGPLLDRGYERESLHANLRAGVGFDVGGVEVDFDNGVIRGAAIMSQMEARGHGFSLDEESLRQAYELMRKMGKVPVYFRHQSEDERDKNEDRLGEDVGYVDNVRISGDVLRGDIHLMDHAEFLPGLGNVKEFLLRKAQSDPTSFGMSAVIAFDSVEVTDDSGNVVDIVARIGRVESCDFVSDPAANRWGLLASMEEATSVAERIETWDEE